MNPDLWYDHPPAPGAAPFDATNYIDDELVRKRLAVVTDIVRTAAEERNMPLKPEQVEQQRAAVYGALVRRHGHAAVRKLANSRGRAGR